MFALVDANNFYVSCERLFRPDLKDKPVVVLSNNDGCVISRSNEAKVLEIPMGAPAFKFKAVFKQNKVHVFSSNYALYGDMSQRIMQILSSFSPEMEVYSIDEAFLKFDGFGGTDLEALALKIKKTVFKATGIPVSIGLAPTKTLAKAANRIAKKFPEQTKGIYNIDIETKRFKALRWLPVEDVWGIGRRHARRLHLLGIKKAIDFAQMPDAWVRKNMTVVGLRLKDELNGQSVLDLEAVTPRKNIATTRTFERDLHRFEDIRERLVTFAVSSAEKLRRQKAMTQTMMVFLNTNKHKNNLPQYSRSTVIKLPFPTNSSIEIAKFAIAGLQQIFKETYAYKKAGIILMDFLPEAAYQFNLFENSDPRHKALMQTMDSLNQKIGSAKLKLASQDLQRTWKMRQEKLSPKYTTRLSDIIKIKV